MRILLTGGSGLVGSNFKESPRSELHELITPGSIELNLLDYQSVYKFLLNCQPDIVIHAAGRVGGIQANINSPVKFLVENIDMGKNIILSSKELGIERLLNLGSSCMYPKDYNGLLSEDMILSGMLEPTNEGYALAKILCQKLCHYISLAPEFSYKTIVPCNIYGKYDNFSSSKSHLLPAIISKIHDVVATGRQVVDIWGDGLARREFMYAGDLADCMYECVERFDELPSVMNVGVGVDHTINEYYQAVADVLNFKGTFVHDISKPVGMARKIVSIEKQLAWGWKSNTSIVDGIMKTYDYFLQHQI